MCAIFSLDQILKRRIVNSEHSTRQAARTRRSPSSRPLCPPSCLTHDLSSPGAELGRAAGAEVPAQDSGGGGMASGTQSTLPASRSCATVPIKAAINRRPSNPSTSSRTARRIRVLSGTKPPTTHPRSHLQRPSASRFLHVPLRHGR